MDRLGNKWTDGWIGDGMNKWIDGLVGGQVERIDRWECKWIDGWLGEFGWMSGQMDELMNEKKRSR